MWVSPKTRRIILTFSSLFLIINRKVTCSREAAAIQMQKRVSTKQDGMAVSAYDTLQNKPDRIRLSM